MTPLYNAYNKNKRYYTIHNYSAKPSKVRLVSQVNRQYHSTPEKISLFMWMPLGILRIPYVYGYCQVYVSYAYVYCEQSIIAIC